MRTVRKILLGVLLFILAGMAAAIILGKVFEDELARIAVEGVNQQIRSEAKVGGVKLSFLRKFPDATLELRDVFLRTTPGFHEPGFEMQHGDTLLAAKHVFLRFNVLKVFRHEYLLREVQVRSGQLNLWIDPEGNPNYFFWRGKQEEGTEKSFLVELENVKLTNVLVHYENLALHIRLSGTVQKSHFGGRLSTDAFLMSAGFEGLLHSYVNQGTVFLNQRTISSSAEMFIDPQAVRISEAELVIGKQQILVAGTILRPSPFDLDLALEGKHLDLENLLRHFTLFGGTLPENTRAGGDLDLKGSVTGITSSQRMPQINAAFNLREGWLELPDVSREIHGIQLSGKYTNGAKRSPETSRIELTGVSMIYGSSRIGGDYSVVNFTRPGFSHNLKTDLNLADIQEFMPPDFPVHDMQGRVLAEMHVRGSMTVPGMPDRKDLLNYQYRAEMRLENVSFELKQVPFHLREFSGEAILSDHLVIKNLNGIFEDSQVSVSGRIDNLLEYLILPDANLWMDLDLYSERVNLSHPGLTRKEETLNRRSDTIFFPERLYLKTRFWLDELEAGTFSAAQITGEMTYRPRRMVVSRVEGLSMDGRIESEGIFEQHKDHDFLVKSATKISGVDITKAFRSFHDFGQEFIVDRQIRGSLSGNVDFSAGLDQRMKIKKESVLSDCDVVIRNGELTGFDPMMKLSRFIDVEELENVTFSTLTNEIFIRNEEVVIPNMDIHSSAFDIAASGLHGFDGNYTYKAKVALSELLAKKSSKALKRDSEFGTVEDDGLGRVYVYLIIEGTPEETRVRYDRRGAVQNIREQLKEEKLELRQILKEELGLFQKDSAGPGSPEAEGRPGFRIIWEEDSASKPEIKGDNNSEKQKFIIEWEDEAGSDADSIPGTDNKSPKRK